MKKVKLNILGLSYSQTQTGAYALVLSEADGNRRIPIIIGAVEAQAIAIQLEGLKPPRPLTHDLFLNVALAFDIEIAEVFIHKLEEGIFYAEIVCEQNSNRIRVDSRTSDAIALALRFECPIFTTEEILDKAGINMEFDESGEGGDEFEDVENSKKSSAGHVDYSDYSPDELNELLDAAITDEDYEKASEIRDELNKRKP
ncbi:MAG TPA: bifunctional nuclease family protein [Prolixibacteraceae bacterium]|nr:bifunctional nuclease family protein [Prolixibacteraceae bacterium]